MIGKVIFKKLFVASLILFLPVLLSGSFEEFKIHEVVTIDTFNDYVREVKFSPFGQFIAITSGDNIVTLYDNNFMKLWTSQVERRSVGGKLAFSPDEKYLAFSRFKTKGDIGILSIEDLKVVQALDAHPQWANSIAYSPDGQYLASGGSEKMVFVWRWDGAQFEKSQVLQEHTKPVNEVAFSPDGRYLASASDDSTIIIWKLLNGQFAKLQVLSNDTYRYESVAFSPDGKLLASGTSTKLTFWSIDKDNFTEIGVMENNAGRMWSLEFSPDSRFLAAALSNGTVKVWAFDGKIWRETLNIYRHNANVFDASFRTDGKRFATASSDQTAVFWDLEGVGPDPVIDLLNSLGLPFSAAQKLIIDRISSRQIMEQLDKNLAAPKDEFETTEEYLERMERLSYYLLLKLQEFTERHFKIEEHKRGEITIGLHELISYNADEQTYQIKLIGTKGFINIPPSEARNLKKNRQDVLVRAKKKLNHDGISHDYSKFILIHPVNGKTYPITMEENPFRGRVTEKKPGIDRGATGLASGPSVNIEMVEFGAVFPVFYKYYDENSIGKAILTNNGSVPIENIRVSLYIKQYMDNPKLCRAPKKLGIGERGEITLYGLFTNQVLEISEGNKVSVKMSVEYSANGKNYSSEFLDTIRIHNRNAITWDDDRKVAAFVTAKDPVVLKFSKNVAGIIKGKASNSLNSNLLMAIALHKTLNLFGMSYVIDPTTPYRELSQDKVAVDFLQFPKQTLEYKAGDCDDLSILYNALLESVGIKTAFITIPGHILTAFSIDMKPEDAKKQFENQDDFIFVDGTTWMPVEITIIDNGFLKAWQLGAKEWQENQARDMALFYPTQSAWEIYEPVGLFGKAELSMPDSKKLVEEYIDEVNRLISREIYSREKLLHTELKKSGETPKILNRLGVLYARYGLDEKAISEFGKILKDEEYVPALMNLGNIYYLQNDMNNALTFYERASKKDPNNPRILLGLTRVNYKLGNYDAAKETYSKLKSIDPDLARDFSYLESAARSGSRASLMSVANERVLWEE
jgi:tetratricopeptide (TPR) repeat protein/Tol biopolymer transport system component